MPVLVAGLNCSANEEKLLRKCGNGKHHNIKH